jgi:hypothetical protein
MTETDTDYQPLHKAIPHWGVLDGIRIFCVRS